MRIAEVEAQTETEKKGSLETLLNMIRAKANNKGVGSKISIDSLNSLMQNLGHSITYSELDAFVKSDETIDNLIADYNQEIVTINTDATIDKDNDTLEPGNQDTVKKMAKRATKRRD
jgi:outer membrane protein OmpA-like peptidoglycan-associated protein